MKSLGSLENKLLSKLDDIHLSVYFHQHFNLKNDLTYENLIDFLNLPNCGPITWMSMNEFLSPNVIHKIVNIQMTRDHTKEWVRWFKREISF